MEAKLSEHPARRILQQTQLGLQRRRQIRAVVDFLLALSLGSALGLFLYRFWGGGAAGLSLFAVSGVLLFKITRKRARPVTLSEAGLYLDIRLCAAERLASLAVADACRSELVPALEEDADRIVAHLDGEALLAPLLPRHTGYLALPVAAMGVLLLLSPVGTTDRETSGATAGARAGAAGTKRLAGEIADAEIDQDRLRERLQAAIDRANAAGLSAEADRLKTLLKRLSEADDRGDRDLSSSALPNGASGQSHAGGGSSSARRGISGAAAELIVLNAKIEEAEAKAFGRMPETGVGDAALAPYAGGEPTYMAIHSQVPLRRRRGVEAYLHALSEVNER